MKIIKESANKIIKESVTSGPLADDFTPVSNEDAQTYFNKHYPAEYKDEETKQWYFEYMDLGDPEQSVVAIVAEFADGTWGFEEPDEVTFHFKNLESLEAYLNGDVSEEDLSEYYESIENDENPDWSFDIHTFQRGPREDDLDEACGKKKKIKEDLDLHAQIEADTNAIVEKMGQLFFFDFDEEMKSYLEQDLGYSADEIVPTLVGTQYERDENGEYTDIMVKVPEVVHDRVYENTVHLIMHDSDWTWAMGLEDVMEDPDMFTWFATVDDMLEAMDNHFQANEVSAMVNDGSGLDESKKVKKEKTEKKMKAPKRKPRTLKESVSTAKQSLDNAIPPYFDDLQDEYWEEGWDEESYASYRQKMLDKLDGISAAFDRIKPYLTAETIDDFGSDFPETVVNKLIEDGTSIEDITIDAVVNKLVEDYDPEWIIVNLDQFYSAVESFSQNINESKKVKKDKTEKRIKAPKKRLKESSVVGDAKEEYVEIPADQAFAEYDEAGFDMLDIPGRSIKRWFFNMYQDRLDNVAVEFEDGGWGLDDGEIAMLFETLDELNDYIINGIVPETWEHDMYESKKVKKEKTEKRIKEGFGGDTGIDADFRGPGDIDQRIEEAHDYLQEFDEQALINILNNYDIDDEQPSIINAIAGLSDEDKEFLLDDLENAMGRIAESANLREFTSNDTWKNAASRTGMNDSSYNPDWKRKYDNDPNAKQNYRDAQAAHSSQQASRGGNWADKALDGIESALANAKGMLAKTTDPDGKARIQKDMRTLQQIYNQIDETGKSQYNNNQLTLMIKPYFKGFLLEKKNLKESMKMYEDPKFEYGGMAIFEFPEGFFYFDSSDPGATCGTFFDKFGIFADATAETFYSIYQDASDNNEEGLDEVNLGWLDFSPRYEHVTPLQVLLSDESKAQFKSIGGTKADVIKIAQYADGALGEDEEEW